MFTQIKENLPLISATLLGIALLRINLYYWYCGVNIMTYVDITESLTLSVPFLVKSVVFMGGIFILYLFQYTSPQEDALVHRVSEDTTFSEKNFWGRLKTYYGPTQYMAGVFLPSLSLISYFAQKFQGQPNPESMLFITAYGFITMNYRLFVAEVMRAYHKNHKPEKEINPLSFNVLIYTSLIIIISCIYSIQDANSAIKDAAFDKCYVVTEKNTVKSTENYRYIGKTKGYIFFYNKGRKAADVYPLDGLKFISIEEVRK